jgi:hypothetical protein
LHPTLPPQKILFTKAIRIFQISKNAEGGS